MLIEANVMDGTNVVRTIKCEVPVPATIAECVASLGNDVALSMLRRSIIIAAQSTMRGLGDPKRKKGRMNDADIAKEMASWKPANRVAIRDPQAKAKKITASLNDEQRAALLAELQNMKPTLVKKSKVA